MSATGSESGRLAGEGELLDATVDVTMVTQRKAHETNPQTSLDAFITHIPRFRMHPCLHLCLEIR